MNTKSFRRNHGIKPKATSSSFISLHFNKADEDQLEISYKNDAKIEKESTAKDNAVLSQSHLDEVDESSEPLTKSLFSYKDERTSSSSSLFTSYLSTTDKKSEPLTFDERRLKEYDKEKAYKTVEDLRCKDLLTVQETKSSTSELDGLNNVNQEKLSPAIEAAELESDDFFSNYINNELEKAKCEIIEPNKKSSPLCTSVSESKKDDEFLSQPNSEAKISENLHENIVEKTHIEENYFWTIFKKCSDSVTFARNNINFHVFVAVIACVCAPIPSWLSGFLVGTILSSCLVYWLYKPSVNKRNFNNFDFVLPQNVELARAEDESGILKGWMNELPPFMGYSPDRYHISCTRSVYVRLDGSYLRFSFPQKNIPKRAMFNEPRHELQFVYQQHYDIADAVVELLPNGLSNKRLWSKKYPICLRVPNSKEAVLSNASKVDNIEGSFSTSRSNRKELSSKKFAPRINENNEIVIYLFSRTDRDKSVWYHRFKKASKIKMVRACSPTLFTTRISEKDSKLENKRTMSVDFAFLQLHSSSEGGLEGDDEIDGSFVEINLSQQQKFEIYMSTLLSHGDHPLTRSLIRKEKRDDKSKALLGSSVGLTWLNVLIGRLFFDFLVEDTWVKLVTEKIQKKLNKIKLPFFLSELTVKDIHLGSALPKIHRASDPTVDEKGLWVDIDLSYNGSFHMTLETKLSLRRLKTDSEEERNVDELWNLAEDPKESTVLSAKSLAESDEDSLESSSDEEACLPELNEENSSKENPVSSSTSKKLMKLVDRLAQSPYFQHAARNRYVKRAMEDLSNTPLVLTVEVQWLTGTLAINVPPWPTDRLWYGFRTNPSLSITARPKLGQHVVTFTQVTEWIEKKLVSEFQKLLVMPNMDDLIIPIMHSDPDAETQK